jgi:hypothetical protein
MTNRIEELIKMAYEAGHHPTSADFADIGPAAKENLRIIVRTLYAAIMTEAENLIRANVTVYSSTGHGDGKYLAPRSDGDTMGLAYADALHARAKEIAP